MWDISQWLVNLYQMRGHPVRKAEKSHGLGSEQGLEILSMPGTLRWLEIFWEFGAQKAIVIMFYCGYNYGCSGSYNF